MDLEQTAGWVAPAATMIAAIMTASNLGARITGWGFVVFSVGSIAWCAVALASNQPNLLWTNGFLVAVNLMGVWRWLGRQASYEDGGAAAVDRSTAAPAPTLFAASSLIGAKVKMADGQEAGTIVEAMLQCDNADLAYVVVSEGGVAGVGERLHAVSVADLVITGNRVGSRLSTEALRALPVLERDQWPARAPEPSTPVEISTGGTREDTPTTSAKLSTS